VETLHSATIIARTPVRALRFQRDKVLALMASDPALSEHFIGKMQQRLVETANRLRQVEQTFGDPRPRLAETRTLS